MESNEQFENYMGYDQDESDDAYHEGVSTQEYQQQTESVSTQHVSDPRYPESGYAGYPPQMSEPASDPAAVHTVLKNPYEEDSKEETARK